MGRNRKWILEDSIQDTVRGPRPPSVRWEKHRSQSPGANPTKKDVKAKDSAPTRKAQAAISALGDADVVEKENVAKALQRAQAQAVVPLVSEQIISTQGFIDRERKRLAAAEEALIATVKN